MNLLIAMSLVGLLLALALVLRATYNTVIRDDALRLPRMMQRRGAALPSVLTEAAARDAALAARRCATCASKAQCDEWLSQPSPASAGFCPNSGYVERLR